MSAERKTFGALAASYSNTLNSLTLSIGTPNIFTLCKIYLCFVDKEMTTDTP